MMEYNNTEQAILDAAQEIFLEKGYKGASTVKIAEKAGVTHAMLHYYFRSKENIFQKILDKEMMEMLCAVKRTMSPEAGLWETLEKVIDIHFSFLNTHRRFPFLMLNVADSNPEMLEKYKKHIEGVVIEEFSRHRDRLKMWVDEGEINEVDPFQLLFTIVTLNLSAFMSLTIMQNVLKMDDSQIDAFLAERKKEIIRTIYMRLYATGSGSALHAPGAENI